MQANPALLWKDGQPYSGRFDDIYFSDESGLQESDYVFLQHNQLQQRWSSLNSAHFTILETGFGTGLNFLNTCRLWLQHSQAKQKLHFVSCEKYPLTLDELKQALSIWPELAPYRDALFACYAHLGRGFQRFHLFQHRIALTLFIGDIADLMTQFYGQVDAWYLDGFAPAKNPEMWQPAVYQWMAQHSHRASTWATFTAASEVRRGLQAAGFEVKKAQGYGRKREMLFGTFSSGQQAKSVNSGRALVIGAGLSGITTALALAQRGWQCDVIEQHHAVAQEASGNPVGVLYPRLGDGDNFINALAQASYQYTLPWLAQQRLESGTYDLCGVLQLALHERDKRRLDAAAQQDLPWLRQVSAEQATHIAGIDIGFDGLFFPHAGWVNPQQLCEQLSQHPAIHLKLHQQALTLHKTALGWQVYEAERLLAEADIVVLANAYRISQFSQTQHCQINTVRGQISFLPSTSLENKLNCVVCGERYLTPAIQHQYCLGASFEADDMNTDVREQSHQDNLQALEKMLPAFKVDSSHISGRAALRSSTSDYLPLLGAVLDIQRLPSEAELSRQANLAPPLLQGLYVHAGHGAKGILQAPLCAEILASQINHEPLPVGLSLLTALNPNRHLLKQRGLKKWRQRFLSPE